MSREATYRVALGAIRELTSDERVLRVIELAIGIGPLPPVDPDGDRRKKDAERKRAERASERERRASALSVDASEPVQTDVRADVHGRAPLSLFSDPEKELKEREKEGEGTREASGLSAAPSVDVSVPMSTSGRPDPASETRLRTVGVVPPPASEPRKYRDQTPPPATLAIDDNLRARCINAGARVPTPHDVAACLEYHRGEGNTALDWAAKIVGWMKRQPSFDLKPGAKPAHSLVQTDGPKRSYKLAGEP